MLLTRRPTRRHERRKAGGYLTRALSYRLARPVTRLVRYAPGGQCYPLCPRCRRTLDREYMGYCDRCGQKLNWAHLNDARTLPAPTAGGMAPHWMIL